LSQIIKEYRINSPIFKKLLPLITIITTLTLFNCSQVETQQDFREVVTSSCKIGDRVSSFRNLGDIKMKGHINISHPQENGSFFGDFQYNSLDSLHIQFRDLLGRQLAQLDLYNNNFALWLQREDRHLKGQKLPPSYSYLTLDNRLTISELRKILLGIPVSDSIIKTDNKDSSEVTNFISDKNLVAASKLNKSEKYIKRVVFKDNKSQVGKILYTEYENRSNILIPSKIIIENYKGPYKVRIKITQINFEHSPLT